MLKCSSNICAKDVEGCSKNCHPERSEGPTSLNRQIPGSRELTSHRLKPNQYAILALVAICAPLGDTLLDRGMSRMAAISLDHPAALAQALVGAVFTPWIIAGIALLIGFFASYLTALSWADLTYVLPATAFGNVIVAFLSYFWLHEPISPSRWAGIALITIGVGFVAQGPSLTQPPQVIVPEERTQKHEEEHAGVSQ